MRDTEGQTSRPVPRQGVVAVIERDGRWLMIRRAEGVIAPGCWCFPGGGVETGESIQQALVREIQEELGVQVVPREVVWRWTRPDGLLSLTWWTARLLDEGQELQPNPQEVAEARWVTLAELESLQPALESNGLFLKYCRENGLFIGNPGRVVGGLPTLLIE